MASKDHTKNGRDNMGNTNTNTNQDSTKENNTNNEKSSEGSAKLNPDRPHRDNTVRLFPHISARPSQKH